MLLEDMGLEDVVAPVRYKILEDKYVQSISTADEGVVDIDESEQGLGFVYVTYSNIEVTDGIEYEIGSVIAIPMQYVYGLTARAKRVKQ